MQEPLTGCETSDMCRRQFLRLLGAAGAAAGLGTVPALRAEDEEAASPVDVAPESTPVRNPAFRAVPGRDGHTVLFCQRPGGKKYLAYDLNAAAARIWRQCCTGEEVAAGKKRTLSQVAKRAGVDLRAAVEFIARMQTAGLVYLAGSDARVYFEYQGPR